MEYGLSVMMLCIFINYERNKTEQGKPSKDGFVSKKHGLGRLVLRGRNFLAPSRTDLDWISWLG